MWGTVMKRRDWNGHQVGCKLYARCKVAGEKRRVGKKEIREEKK